MRVYLDNCCYNRPFDDQSQLRVFLETEAKLFVQSKILGGQFELAWSYVLDYEMAANPFGERAGRFGVWRDVAVVFCGESPEVLAYAEDLTHAGFKTTDALHIACAVAMQCDYLLTTDKRMLSKKTDGVLLVNPIEFLQREVFI